ncbi:hypothetical protein BX661DRAFT_169611 [Kickxella alabastrina]|uniref:uncharacterized protein n=1 Tax=Kickxella alabastrina TaxID=61397 RepID=UPI00221F4BE1|nr:uncharacterized protein BX661DRAFT_169611 [Kickxella alabastrina]KAI7833103.1 hypothetical protein BX661DRAFT_169611 [Kickxella alabastrina]
MHDKNHISFSDSDYSVVDKAEMKLCQAPSALALPGIDTITRREAARLCARDFLENHAFFNDIQYHNHLIHHVLANFSMGASAKRLQEVFDLNNPGQRPAIGQCEDTTVTSDNFDRYLSQEKHYADYIVFFRSELEAAGDNWKDVAVGYFFDPRVLPLAMSGLSHPLIQLGYGLEFESQTITIMALAQTCVHKVQFGRAFSPETISEICDSKDIDANGRKGLSMWQIVNDMSDDPLTDKLSYTCAPQSTENFDVAQQIGVKYIKLWNVNPTELSIRAKYGELLSVVALVYGSMTRPGYQMILEFSIMHMLTPLYFLPIIFDVLSVSQRVILLRSFALGFLAMFATKGCPRLYVPVELASADTHRNFGDDEPRGLNEANPWLSIFEKAIGNREVHVPKVVRALWRGSLNSAFASQTVAESGYKLPPPVNWAYLAKCTVDTIGISTHKYSEDDAEEDARYWDRGMVAFDEFWDQFGVKI